MNPNEEHPQSSDAAGDSARQYLTFIVDTEEYGVDILRVQGIQGWDSVTPIPNTPDYVLGVINLRGSVVPVMDLRRRFGLSSVEFGPTTVVIIVRVESEDRSRIVGMVVDAVSEVYRVDQDKMQPAPELGESVDMRFVRAIATLDDKMVVLLEIDRLLGIDAVALGDLPENPAQDTEMAVTDPVSA